MKSFFTPCEVAKLVNISYRQIQYWDKTNFIRPSYRKRGKYRLYTFANLIQLKVARTLRDHDFSIQRLRKTIVNLKELLPQVAHPLVELTFLIEGEKILVFNGEVLMNAVCSQNYIRFDVKTLREEIKTQFPEAFALEPPSRYGGKAAK
ncbi:MAG: MerR family transcriptional regulator [Candidatus Paceibacterota bacterium]|jgi:DNA-binding transcriptional MerR regulator